MTWGMCNAMLFYIDLQHIFTSTNKKLTYLGTLTRESCEVSRVCASLSLHIGHSLTSLLGQAV